MSESVILALIGGPVVIVITAFTSWFFARRKNNAEAKKTEAEADISELDKVEKAIKIWREMAENLLSEVNKLLEEKGNLSDEISKLNETITTLYAEVNKLKSINNRILCALRNITPENAHEVVNELKQNIDGHV